MSRGKHFTRLVIFLMLGVLTAGCGGGNSGVAPDTDGDNIDNPRCVLAAFADACIAQDIERACGLLLNADRWRQTMERAKDVLPVFGNAVRESEEIRYERDCYRYRVRMRHPDDPRERVMENTVYVARIRGFDGRVSGWGVDFVYPGDGQAEIGRKRARMSQTELFPEDRSAQWGTMYTHASIMSRAILIYYNQMYPEDSVFTGSSGFLKSSINHLDRLVSHPGSIENILGYEYDSYESMPPDAELVANVFSALVQAGSADEDVFVGEYNEDGSVNFLRDIVMSWDGKLLFESTNEFGEDDDTFLKGFAHFLTPETQNIWETDFSEFDDLEILGGVDGAAVRAVDWALGDGVLGPYEILGLVELRGSRNRKTFQRSVQLLEEAGTDAIDILAFEKIANAFYTFGYSLHLLEDCSCPAHCRNDMHGVPIISGIPGLGFLQPDPLEDWGETLTPSFLNETTSLLNGMLAENDPIVRDETGFPENWILQNLYNTAGHTDFRGVEALYEYTAMVANRMCFSEDTIYTSTNYNAANTDNYPYLTDLDLDFFGKSVVYGSPGTEISDDEYLVACGNAMFDVWRSWFWTTHWFSDPEVEDVIDALEGGWDILTVADDDDEGYFGDSVLGVREQQWRLLFPHTVKTGAAYLHELYLETY